MKNMLTSCLWVWTLLLSGCGGGGGGGPQSALPPTPLAALKSSYDTKNLNVAALNVSQIPVLAADAVLWTQVPESLAFGDFFQAGQYSAFVAANQKAGGNAKAYFLKKNDAGAWIDATSELLSDRSVCPQVVQAISADFNNDNKPDIYVVCGGAGDMRQVFFMSKAGQTAYERQETSLTLQQSWGAAAGDIDGDGHVDLVVTDNNLSVALMNNGLKTGANSFSKDGSRIPTSGGVHSFPTLHRKVFLMPQVNGNPDLIISGTGVGVNSTAIYLKNNSDSATQGRFFVNPTTGVSAMFEDKLINNVAVKFYDVVAHNASLYVLAKNEGVGSAQAPSQMMILTYEAASTLPSSSVLNLAGANNGVLSLPSGYLPNDGFISQFKVTTAGRLVAYDGACGLGSQRCAFDIAP